MAISSTYITFAPNNVIDMRANKQYVEDKYKYFNDLCFNGELPMLPIEISESTTYIGALHFKKMRDSSPGGWKYLYLRLAISARYDLPENIVEDSIIHEMIHHYILYKQLRDTSPHGDIFRKIMNDINARYGRNIKVAYRNIDRSQLVDNKRVMRIVCVTEFKTGVRYITVCARSRIFQINREFSEWHKIRSTTWYTSSQPIFSNYPRTTKPRVYKISPETLDDALAHSIRMVFDGNVFRRA